MKEFMLLIRSQGDHLTEMTPELQEQHIKKVQAYIGNLMQEGRLNGAQPLEMEGKIVSGTKGAFKDGPFVETKEVIAGYFLIKAKDLDEAIAIAKQNPVLEEDGNSRIEVRPVKTMEGIN